MSSIGEFQGEKHEKPYTLKQGGGSVMVPGGFAAPEPRQLVIIEELWILLFTKNPEGGISWCPEAQAYTVSGGQWSKIHHQVPANGSEIKIT